MTLQLTKKHSFDAVFDSQKVFRLILEAMSNPARIVSIREYADKLYGESPAFLALAMTLLDNEVGFHVCGDHPVAEEIASLTLAKRVPLEEADFIFTSNPESMGSAIENAKCGTLADPHKSATVIIQDGGAPICRLALSGPGIDGTNEIHVTQTARDAIFMRDAQNYEYPEGVDLIFVTNGGEMFAVPRLAKLAERG